VTETIPIVVAAGSNQVELGLAESLARPGGNVTGFSFDVGLNSVSKGLELLKEAVPKARRVAVIMNPGSLGPALITENARAAARSLGLPMQLLEVRSPGDIQGAFAAIVRERAGALLVAPDPLFYVNRGRLVELAAKHRLPAMYPGREFTAAGGLMSYGPDLRDHFHRTAIYVDKILKGAKPADLPIEQPAKFEFVINLRTAKALGLAVPQALSLRADQLME
jgi:putative ABC transport system substrate-binding protein